MLEDKNCRLFQLSKSSDQKKKKKKTTISTNTAENTEKRHAASLLPSRCLCPPQDQPSGRGTTSEKNANCLAASGRNGKKPHKKSAAGLKLTEAHKTSEEADEAQGFETELCVLSKESLRWEGVLQDPQAEAKRLEQYRANRRLRYIARREAILKETNNALRQTLSKDHSEKKGFG